MSQQQANADTTPTITGQSLLLVLIAAAGWYCHELHQRGNEAAGFGLLIALGIGLYTAVQLVVAADIWTDQMRRHRRLASFSKAQGDGRLGTEKDAKKAGLTGPVGLIFGRVGKAIIRYPFEASVLIAGRPGSWKGVAFVLLNLLLLPRPTRRRFQSYVATDVSGELYAVSARSLRKKGYNVIVVASEAERLSQELGITIKSSRQNPAGYLRKDSLNPVEDVNAFVQLVHPGLEPSKQNGNSEHFDDLARLVLTAFCIWLLDRYNEVTLPGLRRLTMSTSDELHCVLEAASESDAFGGALSESASSLLSMLANSRKEFSGAISTATRSVKLFNSGGPVGQQVSGSDFDWGELKTKPTVVFIMVPLERLDSQAQFLNLTIACSAEALARHRSNRRVTYLLDEVGSMYIPNLMKIVSGYRKCGLQMVLILQQLEAQLARIYGTEASKELQGNCDVIFALSTTNPEDLKRLSDLAGEETVQDGSHTLRETGSDPQLSYSGSYRGRPVLRSDAIRRLNKNQGLLFYGNAPPFVVDLINYLKEPRIRRLADPNPYYKERRN